MSDFDRAFDLVLGEEKGYVNNPTDPGGPTKYGVTEKVARMHGYQGDMKDLPLDFSKEIYRTDYWDEVHGDDLPWPLSAYVFDSAVNQGADVAIKMLQRAMDTVQDGIIGQNTMLRIQKSTPWHWARFMAFRAIRYQGTRNYDKFGEGWLTRIFELANAAK